MSPPVGVAAGLEPAGPVRPSAPLPPSLPFSLFPGRFPRCACSTRRCPERGAASPASAPYMRPPTALLQLSHRAQDADEAGAAAQRSAVAPDRRR